MTQSGHEDSFDHLVSAGEDRRRDGEAERHRSPDHLKVTGALRRMEAEPALFGEAPLS